MKIQVALYVQNRTETSEGPDKVNRVIRCQNVSPKDSVDNAKHLDPAAPFGQILCELIGASPAIYEELKGGKLITMTLDTGN